MKKFILVVLCLLLSVISTYAQNEEVWVTTQDYLSLRLGPGEHWERVVVLPPETTLQAVGRTVNTDWIQVAYTESLPPDASNEASIDGITYGWVSSEYLVWSGNVLLLPVDGIPTTATSRKSGPLLWIGPDTLFFEKIGDFENPVQNLITESTRVEVTGRLGSPDNTYFWIQFELNGRYYWAPTWETGVPTNTSKVLDASYLYPFGRVYNVLINDAQTAQTALSIIRGRWQDLDAGFAATCNDIPAQLVLNERLTISADIEQVPILQAPLNILQSAVESINTGIANFEEVCSQPLKGRTASAATIAESLVVLGKANDELRFLSILFDPIGERSPIGGH